MISKIDFENHLIDATKYTSSHPAVLRTVTDVLAVGDIHGDLQSVERAFEIKEQLNLDKIVFLGDYVDRGTQQIEVVNKLCEMLIDSPKSVILLRGNHEDLEVCHRYGFKDKLIAHNMFDLWGLVGDFFSSLPIFLLQKNNALFVHGGIPKTENETPFKLEDIRKPEAKIPFNESLEIGALWNDPFEYVGLGNYKDKNLNYLRFDLNPRGFACHSYSELAVKETLDQYNLKMLVRGHTALKNGYQQFNPYVLSIHSSSSGVYNNYNRAYAECRINQDITIHQ